MFFKLVKMGLMKLRWLESAIKVATGLRKTPSDTSNGTIVYPNMGYVLDMSEILTGYSGMHMICGCV